MCIQIMFQVKFFMLRAYHSLALSGTLLLFPPHIQEKLEKIERNAIMQFTLRQQLPLTQRASGQATLFRRITKYHHYRSSRIQVFLVGNEFHTLLVAFSVPRNPQNNGFIQISHLHNSLIASAIQPCLDSYRMSQKKKSVALQDNFDTILVV